MEIKLPDSVSADIILAFAHRQGYEDTVPETKTVLVDQVIPEQHIPDTVVPYSIDDKGKTVAAHIEPAHTIAEHTIQVEQQVTTQIPNPQSPEDFVTLHFTDELWGAYKDKAMQDAIEAIQPQIDRAKAEIEANIETAKAAVLGSPVVKLG